APRALCWRNSAFHRRRRPSTPPTRSGNSSCSITAEPRGNPPLTKRRDVHDQWSWSASRLCHYVTAHFNGEPAACDSGQFCSVVTGAAANIRYCGCIARRRKHNAPERRLLLTDAVIELLGTDGIHGVSHPKVDRQAGVPAGTTSFYFRTRKALLFAAATRLT